MKKIKDERLILQNLKIIRIAYIIQTVGIIAILGYDLVTNGPDALSGNPLRLVFILSTSIPAFLHMSSISVDHENNNKSPKKGLLISLGIVSFVSIVIGILTSLSEGFTVVNGVITGGIFFICFIIPFFYLYYLRTKRQDENDDE